MPAVKAGFRAHLSNNGVAPRTARVAMRHSSLDLSVNVYTDPEVLDVAGTVEALPELSIRHNDGAQLTGQM